MLHFSGTLPGATLAAARYAHDPPMSAETYSYYVSGYFGSCHYYFIFFDFDITAEPFNDTMGHLIIQIKEIPWGSRLLGNSVNDWTIIQRENALTGEGVM
jgi:hypothetical protein